ncbi:metallophosphoesterase family protein [Clostridium sp. Marseille-P2415]|uniref:metallophosphoesterase family protein n=1 Tax=Clostridium sp. Marseille-P2415 TaxID=1805471 RepID=UPI001356716E|nr:metallophosphoesterase [Clostridium sp. Marseille-P2415]
MDSIRFAHLSDTHVKIDHLETNLDYVFKEVKDPNANLKELLDKIKQMNLDFVIISGDLVHEGDTKDYECLKKILTESGISIPIFLALGNHDRKDKFNKVFLNEDSLERYYYSQKVKGLKVIVLDSAEAGHGRGVIDERQLDWLLRSLSEPCEKGNIIVSHHPLFWDNPLLAIENSDRLLRSIRESNNRGVFCGHTHKGSSFICEGIFQSVAESSAFGFDYDDQSAFVSDRCGFGLCTVGDREIFVCHEMVQAKSKMAAKIPINTLKTILK